MRYKIEIGKQGEDIAVRYLEERGYIVMARNYRCAPGEIDIIARKGMCVHFIEVKTRNGSYYGYPSESVGKAKQEKIRRAAQEYLISRRIVYNSLSFDVFEVEMNHIENCF
jgi:putative endonuclease